jgi:outer membrane lipoprotein LolB
MLRKWQSEGVQSREYLAGFFVLFLTLTGCSQSVLKTPEEAYWQMDSSISTMHVWSLNGRIAIATPEDSVSINISWIHKDSVDVIELSGPLGQGRVKLTVLGEHIVVDDGERVYQDDVDVVMRHYLKATVPVSALRYWVLAKVAPKDGFTRQERGFKQLGWLISYRQMQQVKGYWLPKKMSAEKANIKLKLIVDGWEIG